MLTGNPLANTVRQETQGVFNPPDRFSCEYIGNPRASGNYGLFYREVADNSEKCIKELRREHLVICQEVLNTI